MALSSPDCLSSTCADEHERGGKRIKLFGTWIQPITAVTRDASEPAGRLEEEEEGSHGDGADSQLREDQQHDSHGRLHRVLQVHKQPPRLQQAGTQEYGEYYGMDQGKEAGSYDPENSCRHRGAATYYYSPVTHALLRSQGSTLDKYCTVEHRKFLEGLAAKGKGSWNAGLAYVYSREQEQGGGDHDGRAANRAELCRLRPPSPTSPPGLELSLAPPSLPATAPQPQSTSRVPWSERMLARQVEVIRRSERPPSLRGGKDVVVAHCPAAFHDADSSS